MRRDPAATQRPAGAVGVSASLLLIRGLTKRCPRCGERKLFRRWLQMAKRCPRCNLVFEREAGAFLGSLALNYAVTGAVAIAFVAVMLALTLPDPPVAALIVGTVGISIVVPLVVYPFAKTTWAAIDLLMHPVRKAP